jgi:TrmH RNA methyltransferase
MKIKELKYYGLHACLALWKQRPQDIIRVYLEENLVKTLSPLLKWCAKEKKVYRIVPLNDLEKISDSLHHEGVCILAKEPTFSRAPLDRASNLLLYLDGVQNPHNLGSILRSSAHFGISAILGDEKQLPSLSPSCCRIAKGGAELVRLAPLENPLNTLRSLKQKGYALIGTSAHQETSLYQFTFPKRSILIIGSESFGVGKKLLNMVDRTVHIPGNNQIESLNVSIATALCMGEYFRQHPL